jgi:hypothetical protein
MIKVKQRSPHTHLTIYTITNTITGSFFVQHMKGHRPHSLEGITRIDQTGEGVIHYTCNAPSEDVLKQHGIVPIGDQFGCANITEVVLMNRATVESAIGNSIHRDFHGLVLDCERALRNIKDSLK